MHLLLSVVLKIALPRPLPDLLHPLKAEPS